MFLKEYGLFQLGNKQAEKYKSKFMRHVLKGEHRLEEQSNGSVFNCKAWWFKNYLCHMSIECGPQKNTLGYIYLGHQKLIKVDQS